MPHLVRVPARLLILVEQVLLSKLPRVAIQHRTHPTHCVWTNQRVGHLGSTGHRRSELGCPGFKSRSQRSRSGATLSTSLSLLVLT